MSIPAEEVSQVRAATDIVALVGDKAALRRQGRRWVGLCPFHGERTPSFSVNAEEGFYYCFGCGVSGDAITFVRETEHLDFVDAVRMLAERAGIALHEDSADHGAGPRRKALYAAMERAVAWYHDRLLAAPDAGPARHYLRSRGITGEVVRTFRLGWAPEGWDAMSRALGVPAPDLTEAGLAFVNRTGRLQDAFRARVIFPIFDPGGRPVALGGRILPSGAGPGPADTAGRAPEPKYKNSVETPIYAKRKTLYGLNWAKKDVVARGEAVVCEGYTDVIAYFQAGVPRAVATCGTALAEEHFTLLSNFAPRIVLSYDADSAGQSATSRVYEWERRHEVEVRVAALPEGRDPGDLVQSDPDALRQAVDAARPFLEFRVGRVLGAADLTTPEGRSRAADKALRVVAQHPDDFVRDHYVMQVADACRVDPDRLRARCEEVRHEVGHEEGGSKGTRPAPATREDSAGPSHVRSGPSHRPPSDRPDRPDRPGADAPDRSSLGPPGGAPGGRERRPGRSRSASRPGLEALRLAVHRPEAVRNRLDEVMFSDDLQRQAYRALSETGDVRQAVETTGGEVADLLRRVIVEEPIDGDGEGPGVAGMVDGVVFQLLREAARQVLAGLQAAARRPDADLGAVATETARIRRWLEDLDDPGACSAASDGLLAWLVAMGEEFR